MTTKAFTFRGSRQRPSASCDHVHDGQPVRGDRSLLPFSRGNHACSHDDGCVAGMFFSFSYRCFNYYYFPAGLRRSSGKEPSLRLGCKVTHIFRIGKELYGFSCPVSCFFSSGGRRGLPIRRPFTANQYRLHTDSATLLQHETDVTAAVVSVYGDRRTGITTAATHACDGRRTPAPSPGRRRQFAAEASAFAPVCTTNLQSDPRAAKHLGQPCVFSAKM